MNTKLCFMLFIIYVYVPTILKCENVIQFPNIEEYHHTRNDIRRPQIGGIQKFIEKLGIAYRMPENMTFNDYYEQYKNTTPGIIEIQSPNYPNPYPVNKITKYTISVENSTGIEFIVHILDIDAENDYLKFIPINNKNEIQKPTLILTGKQIQPIKFRILSVTKLEVEFGANTKSNHNYQGFIFTYTPYGDLPLPTTRPPDVTIPFDELDDIRKIFIISEDMQMNSTWEKIRNLLCDAVNNWTLNEKLQLETCKNDNVTFKSIIKCSNSWPNYSTCIQIIFAISLYSTEDKMTTVNPLIEQSKPKYPAALTKSQLENMWETYGREIFQNVGIIEYKIPDTNLLILLWLAIGFGIVLIVIIILFILCRFKVFKDYINWSTNDEDKENILHKQPEIDITMIPSPEQVIPDVVERYGANVLLYDNKKDNNFIIQNHENDEINNNNNNNTRNSSELTGEINPAFIIDDKSNTQR